MPAKRVGRVSVIPQQVWETRKSARINPPLIPPPPSSPLPPLPVEEKKQTPPLIPAPALPVEEKNKSLGPTLLKIVRELKSVHSEDAFDDVMRNYKFLPGLTLFSKLDKLVREVFRGKLLTEAELIIVLQEFTRLFNEVQTINKMYDKLFSKWKGSISKGYGDGEDINILKNTNLRVSNDSSRSKRNVQKAQDEKIGVGLQNPKLINEKIIFEVISKAMVSSDIYVKSIALLLASGSRPTELFRLSTYKLLPYNSPKRHQYLIIEGLAKTVNDTKKVERPILHMTPDTFLNTLTELRRNVEMKFPDRKLYRDIESKNAITTTLTGFLQTRIDKLFPENNNLKKGDPSRITPKSTREIYITLAFELYGESDTPGVPQNRNWFIQQILGHDDIRTSFHYSRSALRPEPAKFLPTHLTLKQSQLEVKVEHVEEQLKELDEKVDEKTVIYPKEKTKERARKGGKKLDESQTQKILKEAYEELMKRNKLTNDNLRKETHLGSRIVNEFMKSKAAEIEAKEREEKEEKERKEAKESKDRPLTKAEKLVLLDQIYNRLKAANKLTNDNLRKESKIGSRIVNEFMKSKASRAPVNNEAANAV